MENINKRKSQQQQIEHEMMKTKEKKQQHLPDDILTAVFLRLPKASLRRLAAVCKRWRRLISDPFFRRSYCALHPPMLGFYIRGLFSDSVFISTASSPPEDDHPDMSTENIQQLLTKSAPESNEDMKDFSSLEMICASANFYLFSIGRHDRLAFLVYGPVREQVFAVPRLPTKPVADAGDCYGFICHDPGADPPRFKVVRVRATMTVVHVFDPIRRRWEQKHVSISAHAEADDSVDHRITRRDYVRTRINNSVFDVGVAAHGSALYWFYDYWHIVRYDLCRPHELSLVRTPEKLKVAGVRLLESEGQLYYAVLEKNGFRMWVLRKDMMSWNLEADVGLRELLNQSPGMLMNVGNQWRLAQRWHLRLLGLDPADPDIVFLWRGFWRKGHFLNMEGEVLSVNLRKNNELKELCCSAPCLSKKMFPYHKV